MYVVLTVSIYPLFLSNSFMEAGLIELRAPPSTTFIQLNGFLPPGTETSNALSVMATIE
jgi:hypothetical protein